MTLRLIISAALNTPSCTFCQCFLLKLNFKFFLCDGYCFQKDTYYFADTLGSLQEPVTQRHILLICDEVGTAWRDLGAELRLGSPVVRNLTFDCNSNRDRAWEVIDKWRQSNPNEATVGNLVDALVKIGMGKAAQKLVGA